MATVVERIQELRQELEAERFRSTRVAVPDVHKSLSAARELSLAITALEDAQMRYVRARSIESGTYSEHDPDRG